MADNSTQVQRLFYGVVGNILTAPEFRLRVFEAKEECWITPVDKDESLRKAAMANLVPRLRATKNVLVGFQKHPSAEGWGLFAKRTSGTAAQVEPVWEDVVKFFSGELTLEEINMILQTRA